MEPRAHGPTAHACTTRGKETETARTGAECDPVIALKGSIRVSESPAESL